MFDFSKLKVGDQAVVTGYNPCDLAYRQKLLAMGLTRGARFSVIKKAPLGDPVLIELRGFSLSLRRDEATALQLCKVGDRDLL